MVLSLIGVSGVNVLDRYGWPASFAYGSFLVSPNLVEFYNVKQPYKPSDSFYGGHRLANDALWDGQGGPDDFDFLMMRIIR